MLKLKVLSAAAWGDEAAIFGSANYNPLVPSYQSFLMVPYFPPWNGMMGPIELVPRARAEKELAKMRHLEEVSLLGEPDFY